MAIIDLFKDNAKYIDKDSIYLYQDYRKYTIQRVWKLSFWTDELYKSSWELTADKIEDFVDYIDSIFSDKTYRKTNWLDVRDNTEYFNKEQMRLW